MHSGILPPMVLCLLKGKPGAKMHSARSTPPHDPLLSVTFGMIQTNHCCAVLIAVCARPYNEQQRNSFTYLHEIRMLFQSDAAVGRSHTRRWRYNITTPPLPRSLTYDTHNEWLIRGKEWTPKHAFESLLMNS